MPNTILGGGSRLNKLNKIAEHLSRNSRTVYVELTGNDVTGDGSVAKPFATAARAMLEMVGTTRRLIITLGAGSHALAGQTFFSNGEFVIEGAGKLEMATDGTVTHSLFQLNNAILEVKVDIDDVSASPYWGLAGVSNSSVLIVRANTINLVQNTKFLTNGYGQNSFYSSSGVFNSTSAVAKVDAATNSEAMALQETSVTYTNIT